MTTIHRRMGWESTNMLPLCSTLPSNWNWVVQGNHKTQKYASVLNTNWTERLFLIWFSYICLETPELGWYLYTRPHDEPFICKNCSGSPALAPATLKLIFFWSSPKCCSRFLVSPSNVVVVIYLQQLWSGGLFVPSSPLLASAQSPFSVQSWKYTPNWNLDTMAPLVLMMANQSHWSVCHHCHTYIWDQKLIEKEWLSESNLHQVQPTKGKASNKISFFRHRYNNAFRPFWANPRTCATPRICDSYCCSSFFSVTK